MFTFKANHLIILLFIFQGYYCQRRIKDGSVVTGQKKYMVYLLKASVSPQFYDGWICGGALVSKEFIVTSAACVVDVGHLYAIAGYSKYISDTEIYTDPCTNVKKKKIVEICTHQSYELKYERPEIWSYIDIAVVKVESPYDFNDKSYEVVCSYTPAAITINFDKKYQEPGIDALVLGWGHQTKYREEMDLIDYNQKELNYAPVLIQDKEECKNEYKDYKGMDAVIDGYMICTNLKGNINDEGVTILKAEPNVQGCAPGGEKLRKEIFCPVLDTQSEDDIVLIENSRKSSNFTNFASNFDSNHTNSETKHNSINSDVIPKHSMINKTDKNFNPRRLNTRRNGICQNDHGGPLVTWIGAHEYLIGVASAFKVTDTLECIGPYLFTSTQCNGVFLDCILESDRKPTRRANCTNFLSEKGLKLMENTISWKNHPDGPADNEKYNTTHFKEETEGKEQVNNTTELDNTNITNTKFNSTLTPKNLNQTAKAINLGNVIIPINLTNSTSANIKESTSVLSTSLTSTNLTNNTSTNFKSDIPTKHLTNASLTNFDLTTTTILMKNTTINLVNTTNLTNTSKNNINGTTATILLNNASLLNSTTLTNASLTNVKLTTSKIVIKV